LEIIPGADRVALYLPELKDKRVGLVVNQSSRVGEAHLVDTLLELGVDIQSIFSPEHGFKGTADNGEIVKSGLYKNIPIVSLYGSNKKPKLADFQDLDIVIFDMQDVGVRFYTYISTLHYVMQTCIEAELPLLVLDRPNPNGHYVDGPLLKEPWKSFIGMHPVPVVYGMTIGEYAQMINGEGWHELKTDCDLTIVPCKNYTHDSYYSLPVPPSPNLPNDRSVLLYPSLCFFEGTTVSVGRGTNMPFQVIGHPALDEFEFSFTPVPSYGSKNPKHNQKACFGHDFRKETEYYYKDQSKLDLSYLLQYYKYLHEDEAFFLENLFFDKLAGSDLLRQQIIEGMEEESIRESWSKDIQDFLEIRKQYLLYPDFQ
jgi:uncharacterized protein YbbC (DUF1343 family)